MPIRKTKLYRACDGICHYCGRKTVLNGKRRDKLLATIDHIIPKSKLSEKELHLPDNYVLSCQECNVKKGDMSYEEFICKMKI